MNAGPRKRMRGETGSKDNKQDERRKSSTRSIAQEETQGVPRKAASAYRPHLRIDERAHAQGDYRDYANLLSYS